MTMRRFLLIALLLIVAVIPGHEGEVPQAKAQAGEGAAVKKLLIERRDTLRSIEDLLKQRIEVAVQS